MAQKYKDYYRVSATVKFSHTGHQIVVYSQVGQISGLQTWQMQRSSSVDNPEC